MNLTYKLTGTGYIIMKDGLDWIVQGDYIPFPAANLEESAKLHIKHIIEDNTPKAVDTTLQQRMEAVEIALANMMGGK